MTADVVLDSTALHLQHLVAVEQASAKLPSLVAAVVRDGRQVWFGARGTAVHRSDSASAGNSATADRNTQYRIGSITKTMTAVLVMQLRDEGALDLRDRLSQHLQGGVAYGDRTIRQLLAHSAGLPAEPPGTWWERSPGVSYAELTSRLDDDSAPLPVAQQYHYSNLAFGLLGEVVARRRGVSWFEALGAQLLRPLGMTRTTYGAEAPAAAGFSVSAFAGTLTQEPTHDTQAMAAAGQLWSTIDDLARYAAFLADPVSDVLAAATLEEMATLQSGTPEEGLTGGYGLGLRLAGAGERTLIGHTGSMPGFQAGLFVDRERRTGAVCLANGTAGMRCQGLALDLLAMLERHEPTSPAQWHPCREVPDEISDILGLWHWGETALLLSFESGQLVLAAAVPNNGQAALRYRPVGPDSYVGVTGYHTGETLHAVRASDGAVSHLECATFIYTRTPYDPATPIPGDAPAAPDPESTRIGTGLIHPV